MPPPGGIRICHLAAACAKSEGMIIFPHKEPVFRERMRKMGDKGTELMFLAYNRKLLKTLENIQNLIDDGDVDRARDLLAELIKDTKKNMIIFS